jgi:hypothetical protein
MPLPGSIMVFRALVPNPQTACYLNAADGSGIP